MRSRPSWDEYFLVLACDVSLRSEDPDIRHGAVIVNSQNHIIGTGYNGPIKGSDNSVIPFGIRDEKRKWMIHAEENAMLNVTQSSSERGESCRIYITGQPCNNCLQRIINFGIRKIVMIDRVGSITEDESAASMREQIVRMSGVEIMKVSANNPWVKKSIESALS
jgi:dCMP deaminase